MLKELQKIFSRATACSDCLSKEPIAASTIWGVFLCKRCGSVHRELGESFSFVRELSSPEWTETEAEEFLRNYEQLPNLTLEYNLLDYEKPMADDSDLIRKYFIHAKYDQKLWARGSDWEERKSIADIDWSQLELKGFLTKQGFSYKSWKKRWFVITDNYLLYFKSPHDSFPVGSLRIEKDTEVQVCEKPDLKKKNGFTFKTPDRLWYFCADSAEEMLRWIFTIRCVVYLVANCVISFPSQPLTRPSKAPGSTAEKTGYLTKQGGSVRTWKKRYFVLKDGYLSYFKSPQDVTRDPLGIISLLNQVQISEDHEQKREHCFTIVTLGRAYFFCADNEMEKDEWMTALNASSFRRDDLAVRQSLRPAVLPRLTLFALKLPLTHLHAPRPMSTESAHSSGESDTEQHHIDEEEPHGEIQQLEPDPCTDLSVSKEIEFEVPKVTFLAQEERTSCELIPPTEHSDTTGEGGGDTSGCDEGADGELCKPPNPDEQRSQDTPTTSVESKTEEKGSESEKGPTTTAAVEKPSKPSVRFHSDQGETEKEPRGRIHTENPLFRTNAGSSSSIGSGGLGGLGPRSGSEGMARTLNAVASGNIARHAQSFGVSRYRENGRVSMLVGKFEEFSRGASPVRSQLNEGIPRFAPIATRGRGRGAIYFESPFVRMHRLLHDEFMPVFLQTAPDSMWTERPPSPPTFPNPT